MSARATTAARTLTRFLAVATVLCVGSVSQVAPPAFAAGNCRQTALPVALGPLAPTDQVIAGTLCTPESYLGRPATVDVLVPGATYNRIYWDFPTDYPAYSYLRQTLDNNRAVFAYDRLGEGSSSRPLSTLITVDVEAYVLHQVVQWLRGQNGFATVNLVGHSTGSVIAVAESAGHHDSDALVLTGYLHAVGPKMLDAAELHPASLDPRFAGQDYDPGYLTTLPGTRAGLFYYSTADPAVISEDEATKDVISSTLLAGTVAELEAPAPGNLSDQVREPVLLVSGQYDGLLCGTTLDCTNSATVRAYETPYFADAPSLDLYMVPDTGHDVALHPSAANSFSAINQWLGARG